MVATGRTCDLSPATRMARPVPLRSPRRFKTTDLRCDGPAPHGVFTEWFPPSACRSNTGAASYPLASISFRTALASLKPTGVFNHFSARYRLRRAVIFS